jgi:DNA polymerase-3 subunit alpha
LDLDQIPLDDARAIDLCRRGKAEGLYPFDREAMQPYLQILEPRHFEDLMAAVVFYRLMPLENGMTKGDLEREWYPDLRSLRVRSMGPALIYQEDIMRLFRDIGGMKSGEGLKYLRASPGGKDELLENFKAGARRRGFEKIGERLVKALSSFTNLTCSKAWAVSRAYIGYKVAFLKAHFPAEIEEARNQAGK